VLDGILRSVSCRLYTESLVGPQRQVSLSGFFSNFRWSLVVDSLEQNQAALQLCSLVNKRGYGQDHQDNSQGRNEACLSRMNGAMKETRGQCCDYCSQQGDATFPLKNRQNKPMKCETSASSNPCNLLSPSFFLLIIGVMLVPTHGLLQSISRLCPSSLLMQTKPKSAKLCMVMSLPDKDTRQWSDAKAMSVEGFQTIDNDIEHDDRNKRKVRQEYKRKRIPATEREHLNLKRERQAKYDQIMSSENGASLWSFEMLFPRPVWDEATIKRDLYEVKLRDERTKKKDSAKENSKLSPGLAQTVARPKIKTASIGASSMMRIWRDPKLSSFVLPYDESPPLRPLDVSARQQQQQVREGNVFPDPSATASVDSSQRRLNVTAIGDSLSERLAAAAVAISKINATGKVDFQLSRMVEDRLYGYRRGSAGIAYDTSLMGDGAVKFRDGVRLSNPLPVNAARLNYLAKKELRKDRVDEAKELYELAIKIDPADGRAYLGLARCAERRRDFKLAREVLRAGIATCVSCSDEGIPDRGANPFLLQALGCLEEKTGYLAQAEALYIAAAKSRPSHAAAWVALAQIRTQKFRQGAAAGRVCYQTAERELEIAGLPQSAHVYTAWASLEYKKAGDVGRARSLFKRALQLDPKCSAAWLQLGVMEANNQNWKQAEECFQTVLKFDQRNSRVLQAYAMMETKRPEPNSRKAIGLFEDALKVNPRDAGVLQPYGLYVAALGDFTAARDL
jgi:tetratricopeptide (TPR) repeat protein